VGIQKLFHYVSVYIYCYHTVSSFDSIQNSVVSQERFPLIKAAVESLVSVLICIATKYSSGFNSQRTVCFFFVRYFVGYVQFCSVTVERAAYDGNIVFNINVSKYNTRFHAGDVPQVTY